MNTKRALITGVTGQDGSYLADFLLEKDYEVAGIVRRLSTSNETNISHILDHPNFHIFSGDLTDQTSLEWAVSKIEPHEVYNLAAQSFVGASWEQPIATSDITGLGVLRMLEATRKCAPYAHFYQASSSEQFGKVRETPQNEHTPFHPRSPYGVAKCYAHHITVNYRESYGMHASCGILFNHESPRRGLEFVSRKITNTAAKIALDKTKELNLGPLTPKRDWGDARDYVRAMWFMTQRKTPDDFIIATGKTRTIEDMLETTFNHLDLDWKDYYKLDPRFIRPAEVDVLIGDSKKAFAELVWRPQISFDTMIKDMLENDIELEQSSHV